MPPPSWAKRATKLAPKPKPTMRKGVMDAGLSNILLYVRNMPDTPRRLSDTTRKPDTAPPRKETVIASLRLRVAAEAQRTLERTDIDMPMYPDSAEAAAPTRKAMPVRTPSFQWPMTVAPYSICPASLRMISFTPSDTAPMMMAMMTPVASAMMAIVWYWR